MAVSSIEDTVTFLDEHILRGMGCQPVALDCCFKVQRAMRRVTGWKRWKPVLRRPRYQIPRNFVALGHLVAA